MARKRQPDRGNDAAVTEDARLSPEEVREQLQRILDSPSLRGQRPPQALFPLRRGGAAGRPGRPAEGVFDRDRGLRSRRQLRSADRSRGASGGEATAPRARALLSDRRPQRSDPDRDSQGRLRARSASGWNTHSWTRPLRPANPPRLCCSLRRPATRGRAGIGSRPPSWPVRCLGRWDGLARTCSLPDCGPAAARTPRPRCLGVPRSPCCPS